MKDATATLGGAARAHPNFRQSTLTAISPNEFLRRRACIGRNPNAPAEDVAIPESAVVKFKFRKILKQQIKKLDVAKL